MFSDKHISNKLKCAIVTALLGSNQQIAQADQPWNCRQNNGVWDCSISRDKATDFNTTSTKFDDNLPEANQTIEHSSLIEPTSSNITHQPFDTPAEPKTTAIEQPKQTTASIEPITKANLTETQELETQHSLENRPQEKVSLTATNVNNARKEAQNLSDLTQEKTSLDFKNLDWYPYTEKKHSRGLCKGRYISPTISHQLNSDGTADLESVFISADESASEIGKVSTLRGNVDLKQGNKSLHSPLATLDQETGEYRLDKGVTYRQNGLLISGSDADGNINEEEVKLHNARYVLHDQHIRGEAKTITRVSKSKLTIDDGNYSLCPPDNEDWKISADQIELDTESGFGKASHATLQLFGQTVFYFPVFYFPIDDRRKSGFLFPSFSINEDETEISIPYYFNIAPNVDDTLTATLFTNTGLLLENELRYLDENSTNTLSLGYLTDNKEDSSNRWVLGANHSGKYGSFSTHIDYTKISDDDYFEDLGTNLELDEGENDQLNQTGKITYQGNNWDSSLLVQKYQTIDSDTTNPYERLPEIRISGRPNDNFDNISFNYRAVLTRFDRDITGLTGIDKIVGDRLIINPSIDAEYHQTWGYLKPSLKLWYAQYNLENQEDAVSSNQNVAVPILEVDSGLYFDRDFSFQDKVYTQTLEPRLYGLYVPFRDQSSLPDFDTSELSFTYDSLFRDNRFSGDDRFGDAEQISLGLTTRVLSEKGSEILTASIGHAFYFNDRKVRIDADDDALDDNESDFATSLVWRPNRRLRVLYDAVYDADSFQNSETTLDIQYEKDINNVFGIRHRFTENERKQTTFSYIGPINENWSTLALIQHNWLTDKVIDAALGLEYESCCWKTRVILRNELNSDDERDTSLAFQFILKGLGGLGSDPSTELRNKIKGYDEREYYKANN